MHKHKFVICHKKLIWCTIVYLCSKKQNTSECFGHIYYTVNMIIQCIVASACAKKGCVSQNIHVVNVVKLWIHSELICTETSALLKYTLLCSFLET